MSDEWFFVKYHDWHNPSYRVFKGREATGKYVHYKLGDIKDAKTKWLMMRFVEGTIIVNPGPDMHLGLDITQLDDSGIVRHITIHRLTAPPQ